MYHTPKNILVTLVLLPITVLMASGKRTTQPPAAPHGLGSWVYGLLGFVVDTDRIQAQNSIKHAQEMITYLKPYVKESISPEQKEFLKNLSQELDQWALFYDTPKRGRPSLLPLYYVVTDRYQVGELIKNMPYAQQAFKYLQQDIEYLYQAQPENLRAEIEIAGV